MFVRKLIGRVCYKMLFNLYKTSIPIHTFVEFILEKYKNFNTVLCIAECHMNENKFLKFLKLMRFS